MAQLNTKRIVRQCMVPGCRNTNSFLVYKTREPWATVTICPECTKEAYFAMHPEQVKRINEAQKDAEIAQNEEPKDATPEQKPKNTAPKKTSTAPKKASAK